MRRTRGPAVRRWASSNFHVGRDRYVVAVMGPGRAGVVVPIQCSAGRRASRSVPLPRSCSVAAGATHGTCRRWGNRQQVTVSHSSTGRASRRSIRTRIPSHHTRSSVSSIPPPVSFGGRRPIERGPADLLARSPVPVGAGDYPAPAAPGPCTICTSTCTHEIDWSTARRPFRVRLTIPRRHRLTYRACRRESVFGNRGQGGGGSPTVRRRRHQARAAAHRHRPHHQHPQCRPGHAGF